MQDILEVLGYEVVTAVDGQDALSQLSTGQLPGLIFLDITMPVMSGRELLRILHSGRHPVLEKIPVVVTSAVSEFAQLEGFGCAALLRKPVKIESIISLAEEYAGIV